MKKLLCIVLAIALAVALMSPALALTDEVPDGWIGIYTPEDLDAIREDLDANYILMNDIDMGAWGDWEPIGSLVNGEDPDANFFFSGTIDGNGHEIRNMKIHVDNTGTAPEDISMDNGMVAFVRLLSGTIKNLGFVNADVLVQGPKAHWVGGIAGMVYGDDFVNGQILNCYYEGSVIADKCNSLGALAAVLGTDAEPTLAAVRNSYSVGTFMNNGTAQSTAAVRAKEHGEEEYEYYSWTFSGMEGQLAMEADWKEICAGKNFSNIGWDMYSCGGIAGDQYQGTATNCYTSAEQLVGFDYCAWEPVRIEQSAALPLGQMKHAASFTGFDWTTPVWYIKEGETYPKLRPFPAEEPPTDFTDTGTGVAAEAPEGTFDPGTTMQVTEENAGNFVLGPGNSVHAVYDIKFIINNSEVQPNGTVTVRLPFKDVSPGTSANWKVYYVVERDASGKITQKIDMNARVVQIEGVYYWEFETDHFSLYAVVDEAGVEQEEEEETHFWDSWPDWIVWILKYLFFGWIWMRWF